MIRAANPVLPSAIALIVPCSINPGSSESAFWAKPDADFLEQFAAGVPDPVREKRATRADLVFLAAEDLKWLARLEKPVMAIQKKWRDSVVYPEGEKHMREIDAITAGKSAGLTDNKVCGFSTTHTALRFVIPLARR